MGMYTDILFRAEIKPDWADDPKVKLAFETLSLDMSPRVDDRDRHLLPGHEFFDCDRWQSLSWCSSYYFPASNHNVWEHEEPTGLTSWSFRANLKNYDDEIAKFFDWVDPYVNGADGDFLGYSLYEEGNTPTLYFKSSKTKEN